MKLLLKLNNVTSIHALSTVFNPTSLLGPCAVPLVELELEPDQEPQLFNQAQEENHVVLLLNKKHAHLPNAQLTVLWEIGLHGQNALYHVAKEPKPVPELLSPPPTNLERHVPPLRNKMFANLNHAQLTVS